MDDDLTVGRLIELLKIYPGDADICFACDGWGTSSAKIGRHAKKGFVIIKLDGGDLSPEELGLITHGYIDNPEKHKPHRLGWRVNPHVIACGKCHSGDNEAFTHDWTKVNCPKCVSYKRDLEE